MHICETRLTMCDQTRNNQQIHREISGQPKTGPKRETAVMRKNETATAVQRFNEERL